VRSPYKALLYVNQSKFICRNNIIKYTYTKSNNKQRQATRKAKRLNELAAEYNLNNKQIRRKRKEKKKKNTEVIIIIIITLLIIALLFTANRMTAEKLSEAGSWSMLYETISHTALITESVSSTYLRASRMSSRSAWSSGVSFSNRSSSRGYLQATPTITLTCRLTLLTLIFSFFHFLRDSVCRVFYSSFTNSRFSYLSVSSLFFYVAPTVASLLCA